MMPIPKDYLLREGDVVVVLAAVKYDVAADDTFAHVVVNGRHSSLAVDLDKIQGIHAMKWDVGDKVVRAALPDQVSPVCEVLGVHSAEVWVKLPSGSTQTFKANDLRPWAEPRVEVQTPPAAPPIPWAPGTQPNVPR